MLLENNPYPQDIRVRHEAEALVRAGHPVTRDRPARRRATAARDDRGRRVRRFRPAGGRGGAASLALEYAVAGARLNLAALAELARGATVLHLHNPPDILVTAGVLARLLRRRVVFDSHDLFPELVAANRRGASSRHRARRGAHDVHGRDHVLSTNESMAEVARARGRMRAERGRRRAQRPPRHGSRRRGRGARARSRPAARLRRRDLEPGRRRRRRGAAAPAPREHGLPGARLTIVGEGDARAGRRARAASGRRRVEVDWAGWVAVERIPELLAAADICIDPAPAVAAQPSLDDDQDRRVPDRRAGPSSPTTSRDGAHARRRRRRRGRGRRRCPGRRGRAPGP